MSRLYPLYFEDMVACLDFFFYMFERERGVIRGVIMVDVVPWFEPPVVALNPTGCQFPTVSQ